MVAVSWDQRADDMEHTITTDSSDIVFRLRNPIRDAAVALINSHFGNEGIRPNISIPANENEDTDLVLTRGLKESADEIERLRAALGKISLRLELSADEMQRIASDALTQKEQSDG